MDLHTIISKVGEIKAEDTDYCIQVLLSNDGQGVIISCTEPNGSEGCYIGKGQGLKPNVLNPKLMMAVQLTLYAKIMRMFLKKELSFGQIKKFLKYLMDE